MKSDLTRLHEWLHVRGELLYREGREHNLQEEPRWTVKLTSKPPSKQSHFYPHPEPCKGSALRVVACLGDIEHSWHLYFLPIPVEQNPVGILDWMSLLLGTVLYFVRCLAASLVSMSLVSPPLVVTTEMISGCGRITFDGAMLF